jgi:chromosome segregation and condensation protein ScpB
MEKYPSPCEKTELEKLRGVVVDDILGACALLGHDHKEDK